MKLFKNKKGQGILVGVMIFIFVFITLVQFIGPIKDQIITARNPSNLDCDNESISSGFKSTCLVVDFSLFYFFGIGLAAAAAFLGGKFILEKR